MADVQQAPIVATVPTEIELYTASGPSEPTENVSPAVTMTSSAGVTMVTSGSRPLLFASSAPVVDGVAETTPTIVMSTPAPVQSPVAVNGIQINTTPSSNGGSGIVIRAAASPPSPAAQPTATSAPEQNGAAQTLPRPVTVTISPSTGSGAVSSGITIRSSASPTQAAPAPAVPLPTNDQSGPNTTQGQSTISQAVPVQPILINQVSQQPLQFASPAPAPVESDPVQSPSSGTPDLASSQPKDDTSNQQPAAVPTVSAVLKDGVIRAPAAVGQGQKTSAASQRHEEPPITLSELVGKLDLVTVCGFLLAVLSIAFASILTGEDLSISWLMIIVAAASVVMFIRFRL